MILVYLNSVDKLSFISRSTCFDIRCRMFFSGDDDEQDFLSPAGSSRLAGIFGIDQAVTGDGNRSLQYTAPKQPKKKTESGESNNSGGSAVLHAAAVHAYKYIENKYQSQGKLGAAIIGSVTTGFSLLLYGRKQQHVTHAAITATFKFTVQPNNYASFYDEARQSWSLMFETETALVDFTKHLCLTRAGSQKDGSEELVVQDALPGEGGGLEVGDAAEVRYSGWLLDELTCGQMFESNASAEKLLRFKLGKGKVMKGWEEGLLGMKKGGSRWMVVPSTLGYGTEGKPPKVPGRAALVFEVNLVRVKLGKESDTQAALASNPTVPPDPTELPSQRPEVLESKSEKAKLISRIAKMGQPMLPVTGTAYQGETEDEAEEAMHAHRSPKPEVPAKPASPAPHHRPYHQPQMHPPQPAMLQQAPMLHQQVPAAPVDMTSGMGQPLTAAPLHPVQTMQQPQATGSQIVTYQSPVQYGMQQAGLPGYPGGYMPPQMPVQIQPQVAPVVQLPQYQPYQQPAASANDSGNATQISETRQHNSEMRMALTKVSDKIDKVTEKLDHIQGSPSNALMGLSSMPSLEAGVLVHNIQRIVQENEQLKKELYEKNDRIQSQNEKIAELLKQNQLYVEQNNLALEQRNDSFMSTATQSQARALHLEKEKVDLATELSRVTAQLSQLQLDLGAAIKRESELKQQIQSSHTNDKHHVDELAMFKLQLEETEQKLADTSGTLKSERAARREAESQLGGLQDNLSELKLNKDSLEKALAEKKRRTTEEQKRLEEELEEAKTHHLVEVSQLKEKLRKQKSSTDAVTAEHISELEEELRKESQERSDRLLTAAHEKHRRQLEETTEEKQLLQEKLKAMDQKVSAMKSSHGNMEQQVQQLQEQLEEAQSWKTKYEGLRNQASTMKQRYETHIQELEEEGSSVSEERDQVQHERETAIQKGRQLQQQLLQLQQELNIQQEKAEKASAAATVNPDSPPPESKAALEGQVKKIMSSVYHQLRGEFAVDESYIGSEIQAIILETVKTVTLQMVGGKKPGKGIEQPVVAAEKVETQQSATPLSVSSGKNQKNAESDVMTVQSSVRTGGGGGSPDYAAQLLADDKQEKTKAVMAASSSTSQTPSLAEPVMVAQPAVGTGGGGGNPNYAAQLLTGSKEKSVQKKETPKSVTSPQRDKNVAVVARPTVQTGGGAGNPNYAAELMEGKNEMGTEKNTTTKSSSEEKAVRHESAKLTGSKVDSKVDEVAVVAQPTIVTGGGGGNPNYAAKLMADKTEKKVVETVKSTAAYPPPQADKLEKDAVVAVPTKQTGGGSGSPDYAAELLAGSQDKQMHKTESTKSTAAPKTNEAAAVAESAIRTGGGDGNRDYAAQLMAGAPAEKAELSSSTGTVAVCAQEEVQAKSTATTGGGGGSPDYAAQLISDSKKSSAKDNVTETEATVSSQPAVQTGGGGGNPDYTAQLMTGGKSPREDGKTKSKDKKATTGKEKKDVSDKAKSTTKQPPKGQKPDEKDRKDTDKKNTSSKGDASNESKKKDTKLPVKSKADGQADAGQVSKDQTKASDKPKEADSSANTGNGKHDDLKSVSSAKAKSLFDNIDKN